MASLGEAEELHCAPCVGGHSQGAMVVGDHRQRQRRGLAAADHAATRAVETLLDASVWWRG